MTALFCLELDIFGNTKTKCIFGGDIMLNGTNRNVIVVHTDASSRFEAVYFLLKRSGISERTDIVKEANKIITESGVLQKPGRKALTMAFVAVGSALGGAALATAVCLLVLL
jgi:hypothetical protein